MESFKITLMDDPKDFNLLDNMEKNTPKPITIDKFKGGEIDFLEHMDMEEVTDTLTKNIDGTMKGGKIIDITDHFSKLDEEQYEN